MYFLYCDVMDFFSVASFLRLFFAGETNISIEHDTLYIYKLSNASIVCDGCCTVQPSQDALWYSPSAVVVNEHRQYECVVESNMENLIDLFPPFP